MNVLSTASRHYGTYTRKGGLAAVLRIKIMEVLYIPWIRQWFFDLHSQADTSRAANLRHSEGALPAGGELVSIISSEHLQEHQIVHQELSAMRKPCLVVFERLAVPCIFDSRLPSSLINEIDIFTPEPLPDVPNVEVVLRHFHRHCYKNSLLWFFCWRGYRSLGC
jgi:hypothetical protein